MSEEEVKRIINERGDKSPIFFGKVRFSLVQNRKETHYTTSEIVMKGSIPEILKSVRVKKSVLKWYFQGASNTPKKVREFDLSKITLRKLEISKFLGYGVKQD